MAYQFDKAIEESGLKPVDVANALGVSRATITNYSNGSRTPTADKIIQMAELFGVTTDYLLGISDKKQLRHTEEIDLAGLRALHNMPVWIAGRGWALVNAVKKLLIFSDLSTLSINDINQPVYSYPPTFAIGLRGSGSPLQLTELKNLKRVWVEPISEDVVLQEELRGWYHPVDERLVRNEVGQIFYFDFYGSKWLAFESCLNGLKDCEEI